MYSRATPSTSSKPTRSTCNRLGSYDRLNVLAVAQADQVEARPGNDHEALLGVHTRMTAGTERSAAWLPPTSIHDGVAQRRAVQLVTIWPPTTLGKASKCDLNVAKRGVPTMAAVPTANSRIISAIDFCIVQLEELADRQEMRFEGVCIVVDLRPVPSRGPTDGQISWITVHCFSMGAGWFVKIGPRKTVWPGAFMFTPFST